MGYGYGYVADMIEQGGVAIRIGDTGSFDAVYRMSSVSKAMVFKATDSPRNATPDMRATIVHEATHAVIDAVAKGHSVNYLGNECAAYIAQTVYSLNRGDKINRVGPLSGPLVQIAERIRANYGPAVYVCAASELAAIKPTILQVYQAIAKARSEPVPDAATSEMMTGLRPPGPVMIADP